MVCLFSLIFFTLFSGFVYDAHVPTSDDMVFEKDWNERSERIEVDTADGESVTIEIG